MCGLLLIFSESFKTNLMMMNNWTVVRKGKVRLPKGHTGPGGQGQGDGRGAGGAGGGGGAAGGFGGGGGRGVPRPRPKLPTSDAKPNIYDRQFTVVIDAHEFSVLPPIDELVPFMTEYVLKEEGDKEILQQIKSLFCDENTRKYLLRMRDDESTEKLAELLAPGVSWPGYPNAEKQRDVIIHGFSMEKPVMEITMSGIGWWTPEAVVRSVVDKWGDVKECARTTYTHLGHTMETDQWKVKLVKKKDIIIPPVVVHAGSDMSSEEREVWKVFYRGVVKVCYKCFKKGHLGRDCKDVPVNMEYLASQSKFEEPPAAPNDEEVASGEQKTFAQIVKDNSFVTARQKAAELREKKAAELREREKEAAELREREKEEKAAKARETRKKRNRGRSGRGESGGEEEDRGFSIDRLSDWNSDVERESDKPKRAADSPPFAPPDNKSVKMTNGSRSQTPGDPRRNPGLH